MQDDALLPIVCMGRVSPGVLVTRGAAAARAVALVAAVFLAGAAPEAQAQATEPKPADAAPVPAAAARAVVARPPIEVRMFEDDRVRIEETRVRGQLQRIVVRPKDTALAPYEILVGTGGRDPSQDKGSSAGQRVWSVLRF